MKKRIFSGWTVTRALYAAMGTLVIIQSVMLEQWLGVLFGAYLAGMGIFRFSCAAGNCSGESCVTALRQKPTTKPAPTEFETIKPE